MAESGENHTRFESQGQEDVRQALHEEVDRLPYHYRLPIVLCDLEGRSYDEAARYLGCPVGTVRSRLARGRERLRRRSGPRGLAPNVDLASSAIVSNATPMTVPAALLESTIQGGVTLVIREDGDGRGGGLGLSIQTSRRSAKSHAVDKGQDDDFIDSRRGCDRREPGTNRTSASMTARYEISKRLARLRSRRPTAIRSRRRDLPNPPAM